MEQTPEKVRMVDQFWFDASAQHEYFFHRCPLLLILAHHLPEFRLHNGRPDIECDEGFSIMPSSPTELALLGNINTCE
jgi:hypothetical protein